MLLSPFLICKLQNSLEKKFFQILSKLNFRTYLEIWPDLKTAHSLHRFYTKEKKGGRERERERSGFEPKNRTGVETLSEVVPGLLNLGITNYIFYKLITIC